MSFRPLNWLIIIFAMGAIAANVFVEENPKRRAQNVAATTNEAAQLRREGTRIENEVARFLIVGDRIHAEFQGSGQSFRVLENLGLERIALALNEDSHDSYWKISGPLTEFQGQNFLLIERAVRAPKGSAP